MSQTPTQLLSTIATMTPISQIPIEKLSTKATTEKISQTPIKKLTSIIEHDKHVENDLSNIAGPSFVTSDDINNINQYISFLNSEQSQQKRNDTKQKHTGTKHQYSAVKRSNVIKKWKPMANKFFIRSNTKSLSNNR